MIPTLVVALIVSVLLVTAASIAKKCMNTPTECNTGSKEQFINVTLSLGVVGIFICLCILVVFGRTC